MIYMQKGLKHLPKIRALILAYPKRDVCLAMAFPRLPKAFDAVPMSY